jgi:hypothetical protein
MSAVSAAALTAGLVAVSWPTAASATSHLTVINGHRCTKVTSRAHAVLVGTAGNDVLCGLGGNDTLIGGTGNDVLIGRGAGNTASFIDHTTRLVASLATHLETDPTIHQTDHLIGIANLVGGRSGNDVLVGNAASNVLTAGSGNDLLAAGPGNDTLVGGSGNDWLIGGSGHDHIKGGSGRDTIDGSDGGDTIDCGTGSDTVNTSGTDTLAPDCHGDHQQALQRYHGSVSAVNPTANTITVQWNDVNDSAQTWLDANGDPNPLTISLAGANIERGGGGPIQSGDEVEVEATPGTDGTGVIATDVHADGNEQDLQNYHGSVSAVNTTANTVTVQWNEANDAAQTWLDAHGDPNPVTISLAGANIETHAGHSGGGQDGGNHAQVDGGTGGTIQAGDQVEVEATTSADGSSLVAVNVHDEPNWQNRQNYHGSVAAVDTTANTISVQWNHVNDAGQTWLDAHGDPNPVTISLTGGTGSTSTTSGSPIQPGDRVEVEATTSPDGNSLIALHVHDEQGD